MLAVMAKSLNQYREEHYMSVTDFARFLGVSVHTFYSIVRGEKRAQYATMRRVAERLGVHPTDIEEFVLRDRKD